MLIRNGKIVNWKVKIKGFRKLITEDETNENVSKVGKNIYNLLSSSLYEKYFTNFHDLEDFLSIETTDELNDLLDYFYDYCDAHLIWIDLD